MYVVFKTGNGISPERYETLFATGGWNEVATRVNPETMTLAGVYSDDDYNDIFGDGSEDDDDDILDDVDEDDDTEDESPAPNRIPSIQHHA